MTRTGCWNDVRQLGYVLADANPVAVTGADQALRLDDLFDTRKLGGKRVTVVGGRFMARFARGAIGFMFGMDGRYSGLQVFQCGIESLGISLLGLAAEGNLFQAAGGSEEDQTMISGRLHFL